MRARRREGLAKGRTGGQAGATARRAARRAARLALVLGLAAAAGACSSQGQSDFQRLGGLLKGRLAGPAKEVPRPELSRAQLNEVPYATIRISFGDVRAYLVPLADNGGYLDYRDTAGRSIRMHDGALVATEGLGVDLEAVRFGQDDPVANQTPLAEWPAQIFREYQFHWRGGPQYGITLACKYERVARETIEIVEISFEVVRMSEICTNQKRQVVNTYWADPDSGFIWRSEQWLGPRTGQMTVDIIRPYGG